MAVEKIFKKMQAEQAYIALKLGKLKVFISSEDFGKFLSLEMQEIKKQQAVAMEAYVDALTKQIRKCVLKTKVSIVQNFNLKV